MKKKLTRFYNTSKLKTNNASNPGKRIEESKPEDEEFQIGVDYTADIANTSITSNPGCLIVLVPSVLSNKV